MKIKEKYLNKMQISNEINLLKKQQLIFIEIKKKITFLKPMNLFTS